MGRLAEDVEDARPDALSVIAGRDLTTRHRTCILVFIQRAADRDGEARRVRLLGEHYVFPVIPGAANADARKRERAQKRGGGVASLPLDQAAIAEAEARAVKLERWSADRVYEREWAASLLRQALKRLAEECALSGKKDLFESLKGRLSPGSDTRVPYEQLAARLGRSPGTLRSDVARLRERFGAILREEVRSTLLDAADVDGELHYLYGALAG